MPTRTALIIAAALTACGAAATSSNDVAESMDQRGSRSAKQKPARPDPNAGLDNARAMAGWDEGGMPGCFDPSLSGRQRAVAERLGGVPCESGASGTAASGSDTWPGTYAARVEGGTATMSIGAGGGAGRYRVGFEVVTPSGCSGTVDGMAVASGNRLSLIVPVPDSASQCRVDISRSGGRLAAQESGCFYFHCAQCTFTGSYARQGAAATAARAPAQGASWIVGSWVNRGDSCQGDTGLIFERDGSYTAGGSENGRWTLAGNRLSFTALETFVMGEEGTTRIRNPRPVFHQILSRGTNAYASRGPDGTVWNMVRCR